MLALACLTGVVGRIFGGVLAYAGDRVSTHIELWSYHC